MDRKLLQQLGSEMDTICRLYRITPAKLLTEVCGWLDYTYHGVVGVSASDRADETQLDLLDESEACPATEPGVPVRKPKAGT